MGSWSLLGSVVALGLERNTEMSLPLPERYCNHKFTDDCFHIVLLADADGRLLEIAA